MDLAFADPVVTATPQIGIPDRRIERHASAVILDLESDGIQHEFGESFASTGASMHYCVVLHTDVHDSW